MKLRPRAAGDAETPERRSQYFTTADLEAVLRRHFELEAGITSATRASYRWRWTVGRGPVLEVVLEILPKVIEIQKWIEQQNPKRS